MPREHVIFQPPEGYRFELLPKEGHIIYGRVRLHRADTTEPLDPYGNLQAFKESWSAHHLAALDFRDAGDIDAFIICGEACQEIIREIERALQEIGASSQVAYDTAHDYERSWTEAHGTSGDVPRRGQFGIFDIRVQGFDYRVTFTPSTSNGWDKFAFMTLENGVPAPMKCPLHERGEFSGFNPPEATDRALTVQSAAIAFVLAKSTIPVHRCDQRALF